MGTLGRCDLFRVTFTDTVRFVVVGFVPFFRYRDDVKRLLGGMAVLTPAAFSRNAAGPPLSLGGITKLTFSFRRAEPFPLALNRNRHDFDSFNSVLRNLILLSSRHSRFSHLDGFLFFVVPLS